MRVCTFFLICYWNLYLAGPGMTVGPRPWPQGAVSSTEQRTQATEMQKRRDELKVF